MTLNRAMTLGIELPKTISEANASDEWEVSEHENGMFRVIKRGNVLGVVCAVGKHGRLLRRMLFFRFVEESERTGIS